MAGSFSQSFIEKVIDASDIVSVVSQHTALKKSGPRYSGLCPFHNEKTPSFTVTPEKQLYYCFGCQRGGNIVSFVMDIYKYTFPEAIEYLANRAGIPIEYQQGYSADNETYKRKKELYQINKDAAVFYYQTMRKSPKALTYLEKRGLSDATVKSFGIGYAPEGRNALYDYLKAKGYSDAQLLESSLVRKNEERGYYYDYFSNRIMFPILNVSDNVVAFGGRVLEKTAGPKYLNSPETYVFLKHATLFNLNNAKSVLDTQPLVVVEGYMDVISLCDKGVKNTCATLGTALNKEHAKLMMKYTKNVVLCYDADDAGRNAMLRAIDILSAEGLEPRVLKLENNEDPDSYVLKYGRDAFDARVREAVYYTDYKINVLKEKYDLTDIVQMAEFIKLACAAAAQTKDEIKWDYYVKIIASLTKAEPALIKNQIIKSAQMPAGKTTDALPEIYAAPSGSDEAQKLILKFLMEDPANLAVFAAEGGNIGCFNDEKYALMYEEIEKCYSANKNVDILKYLTYNNKLASIAVAVDSYADVPDQDQIKDCIKTLRIVFYENELRALKKRIDGLGEDVKDIDASLLKEYSYIKRKLLDIKSEVKRI